MLITFLGKWLMPVSRVLLCALLSAIHSFSYAAGFANTSSSQHDKLAEHKIITAGNLFIKSRASSRKESAYEKQKKLYELNGICFYAELYSDYFPAMLLIDKFGQNKVAVFVQDYSELKVLISDVRVLSCTDIDKDDTQKTLDDIKEMQLWMKRQQMRTEELQREIKELEDRKRLRK